MLSFVIPAHNEEEHVGHAVASVMAAGRESGEPVEVIVVDDASTDRTAAIAAEHGARVIHVQHRQIAATRNSGARAAAGNLIFFVDADTQANPEAVGACLQEVRRGAVAGGCLFRFDGVLPFWARVSLPVFMILARRLKFVGGCFLFCTREAFEAVGGFCEQYYAAEELVFIQAVKAIGRVAVPKPLVVTSGRKLRAYSGYRILRDALRVLLAGRSSLQRREGLDIWYAQRLPSPALCAEPEPAAEQGA
jgi:glycosyltransferase involved in cell wall biosynthesis